MSNEYASHFAHYHNMADMRDRAKKRGDMDLVWLCEAAMADAQRHMQRELNQKGLTHSEMVISDTPCC